MVNKICTSISIADPGPLCEEDIMKAENVEDTVL